jgi:hypothetical protein
LWFDINMGLRVVFRKLWWFQDFGGIREAIEAFGFWRAPSLPSWSTTVCRTVQYRFAVLGNSHKKTKSGNIRAHAARIAIRLNAWIIVWSLMDWDAFACSRGS